MATGLVTSRSRGSRLLRYPVVADRLAGRSPYARQVVLREENDTSPRWCLNDPRTGHDGNLSEIMHVRPASRQRYCARCHKVWALMAADSDVAAYVMGPVR